MTRYIPSSSVEVVDRVGVLGGLDVGCDLLVDRWIDLAVDKVDIEVRGIGAVWS